MIFNIIDNIEYISDAMKEIIYYKAENWLNLMIMK